MPLTLHDLLVIEETSDVLEYHYQFDDMPMWPLVRIPMMFAAFWDAYGLSNAHNYTERLTPRDIVSYIFHTISKNPFTNGGGRNYEIVIFGSGINNVQRGGKYFNRLHDYLALEYVDTTLFIEDSIRRKYLRPREFQNLKYHDLIPILGVLESKITRSDPRDLRRIRSFLSFLKARFPYQLRAEVWARVELILLSRAKRSKLLYKYYNKLLDVVKPRIIFLEDASYGQKGHILKWAKDKGITTAELQHGLITGNHPAYNYGQGILSSSSYAHYLPDYLLTYGQYWNAQIHTLSQKVVLGDPNLTEYVKNAIRGDAGEKRKLAILVISTGINPEGLNTIVRELIRVLDPRKFEVRLRPHPLEMPLVKERYGELAQHGNVIDLSSDLYESLSRTDFVAGEVSTVLFEAVYFGKPVFAMDHPYTNLCIGGTFPRFKTGEELANLIMTWKPCLVMDGSLFWEEDWRRNYGDFIRRVRRPEKNEGEGLLSSNVVH